MITTNIKRIIRSGFVGFWRNAFVSFSAIFVITVTLFVIGGFVLFSQVINTSLDQIRNKVDITVYMVVDANEAGIRDLQTALQSLPDVKEVVYSSREEELSAFRERHKGDELMIKALEELDYNPLAASLSIRAKDPSQYQSIADFLKNRQEKESATEPIIHHVNYNQNKIAIDKLTTIIHTVDRASYFAMIILIASSILIAFNTIRLAIYTAREEISVMRLVGASNMFIRGPFMLQGAMYGLIAGVLTLLIIYPILLYVGPFTETFFLFNIFEYFVNNFGHMFLVIVGSGVALGLVSSTLAIARYLRI